MNTQPDFEELLRLLEQNKVRYNGRQCQSNAVNLRYKALMSLMLYPDDES